MKSVFNFLWIIALGSLLPGGASAQVTLQFLGLENKQVTSLDIYQTVLAAGTDHQGVYYQDTPSPTDTGWVFLGLDTLQVNSVYAHNGPGPIPWIISAGVTPNPGSADYIFCSVAGQPFVSNSLGISDTLTQAIAALDGFPTPLICGETFAAGNRALYRSAGDGTPWTPVYTATIEGDIRTVRVHEEYPDMVLAGGSDGFAGILLIKSLDKGETWEDISPFGMVADVDFAGDSAQTIFAACYNIVFRSTDAGASWTLAFNGTLEFLITRVIFLPPATVYIAGEYGQPPLPWPVLFYSGDLGNTWQQISLNMIGRIVDLEAGPEGWIYFATPNSGVYRFQPLTGIPPEPNAPATLQLFQNYPNPFNPETAISYQLSTVSNLELAVYNSLGQKIRTLVQARQPAGRYQVKWDGRNEAGREVGSGIYIYRLKAGQYSISKKMILIR